MGEADHYRTLGLRRDATKAEIKAAFSRLALLHHPDRHARAYAATRADATRRFRQAYDAYHVLYDDGRRAEYDLRSSSPWSRFGHGSAKSHSSSSASGHGSAESRSSSDSGHGSAKPRSSSASGHGSAKPRSSSASGGSGHGSTKSRSSSPSGGFGHGSAKSRSSSPSGRYGYPHGRGGDFQDWPSPRETESLGVWVRANWYPLLCCTLRVAEVLIDGWKLYNTCKSWWQSSTEKEAAESEEKMNNEPSEEKK